ncbi:hypothetical protein I7N24_04320 [Neisseria meningitidis]|uniref:hypothetical protein n=1 Tax=Neisseria meningitidis TaxID=487 RepID=UPI000E59483E|nr:hypothetical protein [Neisseria meningitidis]MBH2181540.1 hypothetical protein [Neisseria meningitidis]MBH2224374.1 hypothetical protein [Neisseria meningitidis]MBH2237500.1 hypothetical protein [Neisseria meningitidis]MBH2402144.1 hypothetical protein [Neisseria meningitidis]MBH2444959.1 hypothetical protein [Neisseria meningitidis]
MYIRLRYFILGALVLAAHWLMTDTTEAQAQNREPQTLTEIVNEVDAKWGEPGFDYTRGDAEIPDVSVCESLR